jgi:hypothetical protein
MTGGNSGAPLEGLTPDGDLGLPLRALPASERLSAVPALLLAVVFAGLPNAADGEAPASGCSNTTWSGRPATGIAICLAHGELLTRTCASFSVHDAKSFCQAAVAPAKIIPLHAAIKTTCILPCIRFLLIH